MSLSEQVFTHAGDERTVREWCDILNISYNTVKSRHARGARSFEKLFNIKPVQVRRLKALADEQGEHMIRHVDLLELLFSEALRNKILALAKAESDANKIPYSVRKTLNELVRCGILYKEKQLYELELERAKYDEWYRINHPDGINNKGGWTLSSDHVDEVETHNTFQPALTKQQEIDEIDALFK